MDAEYATSIKGQDDNGYIRLTYSVPEDEKTRQSVSYFSEFVLVSLFFPSRWRFRYLLPVFHSYQEG